MFKYSLTAIFGFTLFLSASARAQKSETPLFWQSNPVQETLTEETPETLLQSSSRATLPFALPELEPKTDPLNARIKLITYRMPHDFSYEFTLLVIDGKIQRAFIVSTALPGKDPILGIHRLSLETGSKGKPFPWRRSVKFDNSPMFWATNISGGFFIHSTPHYGNLGRPASMGCIRASLPDAMEVFDTLANKFPGVPAYSFVYEKMRLDSQSPEANLLLETLQNSDMTIDHLKEVLASSRREVIAVSHGDLSYRPGTPVDAHVRPYTVFVNDQKDETNFPSCSGVNCWDLYKHPRAILKIKANALSDTPEFDEVTASSSSQIKGTSPINLNSLVNNKLASRSIDRLFDISLSMQVSTRDLEFMICDLPAKVCSKTYRMKSGLSDLIVIPMYQVSNNMKASANLSLVVKEGAGSLASLTLRFIK